MAASGWVSQSCKNTSGERVGRATNHAHGDGRTYKTRPPVNAWNRLHYDQWCLGSLQQMHVHPLLTPNYVLAGCNGTTRDCNNVCSCWCPNSYTSVSHSHFYAQGSVAVGFVDVQPGFLQLLSQTWVKCTSLDSSRCVVYSGIRFKAIWAASK